MSVAARPVFCGVDVGASDTKLVVIGGAETDIRKYRERLDRMYDRVLQGKATVVASLTGFAEQVAGDVRRNITKLRTPPNAPATITKKGSSNPLIDTGTMRQSVRGRVIIHGMQVTK